MPKAGVCGHQRTAEATPLTPWWRRQAGLGSRWVEGRLLANESVFLLKFMAFCRSVLYVILALAFQAQYSPHSQPGRAGSTRFQGPSSRPRSEAGETRDHPCFRPTRPLPAPPLDFRYCAFPAAEDLLLLSTWRLL